MKKVIIMFILLPVIFSGSSAFAINFFDGAKAPDALYFITYSSFYHADTVTDSEGEKTRDKYGMRMAQEIFRLAWYNSGIVLSALAPFGGTYTESADKGSFGAGDISLGGGCFLPVDFIDILPMFFVKFPTGEYNRDSSVNLGSNQYDFKPMLFIHKTAGIFTVDFVAKYYIRLENKATKVKPGNELYTALAAGINFYSAMRTGPSVSWTKGQNRETDGHEITGSAKNLVSCGFDFYWRMAGAGFTLTSLWDVYSVNTVKGFFVQLKTVHRI